MAELGSARALGMVYAPFTDALLRYARGGSPRIPGLGRITTERDEQLAAEQPKLVNPLRGRP